MGVHVRGCRCVQGWLPALYPCGVTTEEAKRQTLTRRSKPMFARLPNSSHDVPTIVQDMETVNKMGPMNSVGLL
jgi:hypothetical protein